MEVTWVFPDQRKSIKLEHNQNENDTKDIAANMLLTIATHSSKDQKTIQSTQLPVKRTFNWLETVLSEEKEECEVEACEMNVQTSSNPQYSMNNFQTAFVTMYYDALCTKEIPPNTQINKDIIFYFSLAGAVPPSSFGSRLSIDEKVLYLGKRKTFQGGQPFPHTLSAVLFDNSDRQEIELCSTCRRKNEQILKIRSALIDDKGLIKVATSVTCSGNPPSNKRALFVSFKIVDKEQRIVWAHDSSIFTIFHHRSKQKIKDINKILKLEQEENSIVQQNQKYQSTVSMQVAEEFIAASFGDESTEKLMMKLITDAMREVYICGPVGESALAQYFHSDFDYSPHTEDVPSSTSNIELFVNASLIYSSRMDETQWLLDEGICKGTLADGRISTRIRLKGKWTRPVGQHQPTGEIIEPVFYSFWTVRNNKIFAVETAVNHNSPRWRLAWLV